MKKDKNKKKPRVYHFSKKPPRSLDHLTPAFQNGKFLGGIDETLILRRDHRPDKMQSYCTVMWIDGDEIALYDETIGQWLIFNVKNPPTLYLLRPAPVVSDNVVEDKETPNNVSVDKECKTRPSADVRRDPDEIARTIECAASGVAKPNMTIDV